MSEKGLWLFSEDEDVGVAPSPTVVVTAWMVVVTGFFFMDAVEVRCLASCPALTAESLTGPQSL